MINSSKCHSTKNRPSTPSGHFYDSLGFSSELSSLKGFEKIINLHSAVKHNNYWRFKLKLPSVLKYNRSTAQHKPDIEILTIIKLMRNRLELFFEIEVDKIRGVLLR